MAVAVVTLTLSEVEGDGFCLLWIGGGGGGGQGGGGGGIGGSLESSISTRGVLGAVAVSDADDELECAVEADVDADDDTSGDACDNEEKYDLLDLYNGAGGTGGGRTYGRSGTTCSFVADADDEQSSASAASLCFLTISATSISISRILRFLLAASITAASSSAHSRAFSASRRLAVSLHRSRSPLLAASSASRNGTMATVSLRIFCSRSSTRSRDSRSWSCSMARSSSATSGGARAAGRTCAEDRGK
jgi:hypothetical protein